MAAPLRRGGLVHHGLDPVQQAITAARPMVAGFDRTGATPVGGAGLPSPDSP